MCSAPRSRERLWCQRRDSNSQTPVSKTGCYSNSHTLAPFIRGFRGKLLHPRDSSRATALTVRSPWCTGEDLNLRVLKRKPGYSRPVSAKLTHLCKKIWRKVDESNAHGSSPCPGFQDQLPTIQRYLPHWRRVWESNPLASYENSCLAGKCLTVRPTLR